MNNCMNRNFNSNAHVSANNYNEALGERILAFFCLVVAFFENNVVDAICRISCGCALVVGAFFYASAVMGGTVSVGGIVLYGVLLVAVSAIVFRTPVRKGE